MHVIINEIIDGTRATYRDFLAAELAGKNVCEVEMCVAAFVAAYPNITQGEIHQAFVDNDLTMPGPPPMPA